MSAAAEVEANCSTSQAAAERVRLDDLTGESAVPRSNGELIFDAPWHARAFGMAVSLCQSGEFEWVDFQRAISHEIARTGQSGVDEYYECWLTALTEVMTKRLNSREVHQREAEFRSHERDDVF